MGAPRGVPLERMQPRHRLFRLAGSAALLLASCHLLVPLDDLRRPDSGSGGATSDGGGGGDAGGPGVGGESPIPPTPVTPPPCVPPEIRGRSIHVSLAGSDTNSGSLDAPLRTVTAALLAAAAGDAVVLGEGTFVEASTLTLRAGVSLAGAGPTRTTIRVETGAAIVSGELVDASISGIALDGNVRTTDYGLLLGRVENAHLGPIRGYRFGVSSLTVDGSLGRSGNLTACALDLLQCGSRDEAAVPFADHACLELAPMSDVRLFDVRIDTDAGPGLRMDASAPAEVAGFRAEFLDVRVPAVRNDDNAPQYALTIRNALTIDADISTSTFAGLVALWQSSDADSSARIHRCRFLAQSAALEIDASGVEVDHNHVVGGYYWLFNFNSSAPQRRLRVHHNVLEGQTPPAPLGNLSPVQTEFLFAHNTVVLRGDLSSTTAFSFADASDVRVLNNLFLADDALPPSSLGAPEAAEIRGNHFSFSAPPGSTENYEGAIAFVGATEADPDPRYRLAPESEATRAALPIVALSVDDPRALGACSSETRPCVGHAWSPK